MRFKLVSATIVAFALAGCGRSDGTANAGRAPSPTPNVAPSSANPAPSASPVAARESEFVAHGNEPFWSIETHADRIVYSSPEKPDGETLEVRVSQANGWTRFDAEMDDVPLLLEVRKAPCSDDMSGFAFSHEARLTRADGTWMGCARLASEPQPRE
jgi:uncharacterized membrane protein